MFTLTDQPITPRTCPDSTAGGLVTFEGRVRVLNEGKSVQFLEYDAFGELAESEGTRLLEEAKRLFALDWVEAIHRVGKLEIGETAVWIGCGAPHRKEAFLACEFIIDELKVRLPIWKKEQYQDGPSEWISLQNHAAAAVSRKDVFARQIGMPELGLSGQIRLQKARVLVVGAGGLASSALSYLAGAGVGALGIVEPDVLEASNLHRQVLYGYQDLGRSKAQLAAAAIRRIHPFTVVEPIELRLTCENAESLISRFDVVVDGTDRLDAKFLMNDVCQRLGRPLVQASIHRMEGMIQTIVPGGPCLRCQWPVEPVDGCVSTCAETGVFGVVPGLFGILQAAEVVKLVTGIGTPLSHSQLLFDVRDGTSQHLARPQKASCVCQGNARWRLISDDEIWEVPVEVIRRWQSPFVCLDLRERDEDQTPLELGQQEWRRTPLSEFQKRDVPEGVMTVLVCSSGTRSALLTLELRDSGMPQVVSLLGGVDGNRTHETP